MVQGDVFEASFEITNIDNIFIDKVIFSSKELKICEIAEKDKDSYVVRIEGKRTALFPSGFFCYDLTVKFISGEVLTVQHNEYIEILKKVNGMENEQK
jgi:hypothetical protein